MTHRLAKYGIFTRASERHRLRGRLNAAGLHRLRQACSTTTAAQYIMAGGGGFLIGSAALTDKGSLSSKGFKWTNEQRATNNAFG